MFPILSRRVPLSSKHLRASYSDAVSTEVGLAQVSTQVSQPAKAMAMHSSVVRNNFTTASSFQSLSRQNCCFPSLRHQSQGRNHLKSKPFSLHLPQEHSGVCVLRNNPLQQSQLTTSRRTYFTNGKVTKDNDPYELLGLQWGDGATSAEIKKAFLVKARELHPDLNTTDSPEQAQLKFQKLVKAYETLVPPKDSEANDASLEDWRLTIWRQGDRIALDRTDVAGQARVRPAPPAKTPRHQYHSRELGHPQGVNVKRGEYLEAGSKNASSYKRKSSSVGTGRSKWVKPKEFKPWNPNENEGEEFK
ncbi:unnamed protein product [Cylindrotheca closterium]|uniref:J domain-containing protein n=1 Tax=Cylindrotheca closterium TaxID=2856 RepID=A0AAD2GE26_9STRA|nr:unnamed protein product [Cylindrotheca closterium]